MPGAARLGMRQGAVHITKTVGSDHMVLQTTCASASQPSEMFERHTITVLPKTGSAFPKKIQSHPLQLLFWAHSEFLFPPTPPYPVEYFAFNSLAIAWVHS